MNIDDRLRAASRALRDSSVAQVDAATPLREIVLHTDQPQEPPGPLAPSPPPAARWRRAPQRLALAVNLLLVLALGIVIGIAAISGQDAAGPASAPSAPSASTVVVTQYKVRAQVPEACIDTAELGDEVIARLNRNERDSRLALALRDYTIASQACRRAASP